MSWIPTVQHISYSSICKSLCRKTSSFYSDLMMVTSTDTCHPQDLVLGFTIQFHLLISMPPVSSCTEQFKNTMSNVGIIFRSYKISIMVLNRHTVIYLSLVMKHEAGVACFLTLTERKYGCREQRQLANHCRTTSRQKQNYQRKTNGGIDSLVVYLQPSTDKK